MISIAQRITLLHSTTLFAGLEEQALVALARRMVERRFVPGQTIFYEGDLGQFCFLVVSGRVQIVRLVDTAREIVLNEALPGTIVGELSLFGGQQRMATSRALEPTVALELSREALDLVLAAHPKILDGIVKTLLLYLQHALSHAAQMERQALGGGEMIQVGPGQRLGQYAIELQIGQGGQATVYLARNVDTGAEVALKVLSAELSQRPGFLERFRREAIICSSLSHQHVVPVYSFGERGGVTFIASRLVRGGTLADRLGQPLSFERAGAYLQQIAAALDYAHSQGLIHLDVKPSNILVDEQDRCYLADFGIAAMIGPSIVPRGKSSSQQREIVGSPSYLSPEQMRGELPTAASDIYSLGIVLYEMVTGRVPFQGATSRETALAHVRAALPSPRLFNPDLSPATEAVLRRALSKQPIERFARAGDLAQAWRAALLPGATPDEVPSTQLISPAMLEERTAPLAALSGSMPASRRPLGRGRAGHLDRARLRKQRDRARTERDQLRVALAEALEQLETLQKQRGSE